MKLFFGLALEPELALAIADWRDRQFGFSARPVPVANFHITLAYAGELSVLDSDILCEQVDSWHAKGKFRSGQLLLDQTGYWASPGIYWLGPAEATPALASAAAKLDSLIAARGARPQRRKKFQPHITLFRQCEEAPPMPAQPPSFEFAYRSFSLFESRRLRQGVAYEELHSWPLLDA